jgi:UDP-N-acetylmuramyl pentapeptide phosphotransferase/UDP-N-acetylglucosamine-1-phosphate transferase
MHVIFTRKYAHALQWDRKKYFREAHKKILVAMAGLMVLGAMIVSFLL